MQNLRVIDKGGRPRKEFVRQHILDLISKLKYAYPKRVHQEYSKEIKDESQQVSYMTILRYMEQMAKEDGPLKRTPASSEKENTVYLYQLRMERDQVM